MDKLSFRRLLDTRIQTRQNTLNRAASFNDADQNQSFLSRHANAWRSAAIDTAVNNFGIFGKALEDKMGGQSATRSFLNTMKDAALTSATGRGGNINDAVNAALRQQGPLGSGENADSIQALDRKLVKVAEILDKKIDKHAEIIDGRIKKLAKEYEDRLDKVDDFIEKTNKHARQVNSDIAFLTKKTKEIEAAMKELETVARNRPRDATRLASNSMDNPILNRIRARGMRNMETRLQAQAGRIGNNLERASADLAMLPGDARRALYWGATIAGSGIAAGGVIAGTGIAEGAKAAGAGVGNMFSDIGAGAKAWMSGGKSELKDLDETKPIDVSISEDITFKTKKVMTFKARKIVLDADEIVIANQSSLKLGGVKSPARRENPQVGGIQGSMGNAGGLAKPEHNPEIGGGLRTGEGLQNRPGASGGSPAPSGGRSGGTSSPSPSSPSNVPPSAGSTTNEMPNLVGPSGSPSDIPQSGGRDDRAPSRPSGISGRSEGPQISDVAAQTANKRMDPASYPDFSRGGKDRYDKSIPAPVRHNNPGASYGAEWMKEYGMNGVDRIGKSGEHQIANFPTAVHGAAANIALMDRGLKKDADHYANQPLGTFIERWSGGNSSSAYTAHVAKALGIKPSDTITREMIRKDGWKILKAQAEWEAGKGKNSMLMTDEHYQEAHRMFQEKSGLVPPSESAGASGGSSGKRVPLEGTVTEGNLIYPSKGASSEKFFFDTNRTYSNKEIDAMAKGGNALIGFNPEQQGSEAAMKYAKSQGARTHAYYLGPGEPAAGYDGRGRAFPSDHAEIDRNMKEMGLTDRSQWRSGGWYDWHTKKLLEGKEKGNLPDTVEWDNMNTLGAKGVGEYMAKYSDFRKTQGITTQLVPKNLDKAQTAEIDRLIKEGKIDPKMFANRQIIEEYADKGTRDHLKSWGKQYGMSLNETKDTKYYSSPDRGRKAFEGSVEASAMNPRDKQAAMDAVKTVENSMTPYEKAQQWNKVGPQNKDKRSALSQYLYGDRSSMSVGDQAWCADFMNATLKDSGIKGTGSSMARSFEKWGQATNEPKIGDIAVFHRDGINSGKGHVGFFAGYDEKGNVKVFGGNQGGGGGQVNYSVYPKSRLLGFRTAEELHAKKEKGPSQTNNNQSGSTQEEFDQAKKVDSDKSMPVPERDLAPPMARGNPSNEQNVPADRTPSFSRDLTQGSPAEDASKIERPTHNPEEEAAKPSSSGYGSNQETYDL